MTVNGCKLTVPIQEASSWLIGIELSFNCNCGSKMAEYPDVIPEKLIKLFFIQWPKLKIFFSEIIGSNFCNRKL